MNRLHLRHLPSESPEMRGGDSCLKESVDLLQRLVRLHPVYGSSGQAAALSAIEDFLKKFGANRVVVDDFMAEDLSANPLYVPVESFAGIYSDYCFVPKRNVMAYVESDTPGPTLILNGHVDVDLVSTPELWDDKQGWWSGHIKNGHLYGRGATDMLGGLCGLLCITARLASDKSKWRGRVILTAVCDEEIGGNGTLRALELLKKHGDLTSTYPVQALIAEPTEGHVCNRTLGFSPFSVNLRRSTVHMGVAGPGDSLFEDLCRVEKGLLGSILEAILRVFPNVQKDEFRCSFGIVRGGVDPALPLSSLLLEGTIFTPPIVTRERLNDALVTSLRSLIRSDSEFDVTLGNLYFGGSHVKNSELLTTLLEHSSEEKQPTLFPSPCDARLFEAFGIDCLVCGPGMLKDAHAVNEKISLSELRAYIERLYAGIKCFLKHG